MTEEKLPEWFEEDFFVHDHEQRSWDELEVGEEYETVPFTVTRERILKYAEGTEDLNPVFCDEEAAKGSQFRGMIRASHNSGANSLPNHAASDIDKDAGRHQSRSEAGIRRSGTPGDTLRCKARMTDKYIKRGRKYAIGKMRISNQNDETVCVWTGGLILPR